MNPLHLLIKDGKHLEFYDVGIFSNLLKQPGCSENPFHPEFLKVRLSAFCIYLFIIICLCI